MPCFGHPHAWPLRSRRGSLLADGSIWPDSCFDQDMNPTPECAILARLLEHQTVALLWLDARLQVVYLNPSAENLLG